MDGVHSTKVVIRRYDSPAGGVTCVTYVLSTYVIPLFRTVVEYGTAPPPTSSSPSKVLVAPAPMIRGSVLRPLLVRFIETSA